MKYLYSVAISFIIIYTTVYCVLRKKNEEKHIFNSFTFYFILYLSILPIVNMVFAFLFILIPIFGKQEIENNNIKEEI